MIARRTPLKRKRPTKRRRLAGCPVQRCTRPPYRRDHCANLCRHHLVLALDGIARSRCLERYGHVCAARGYRGLPCTADSGTASVQWAHIIRRGRGLVRRLDGNARPLCQRHHTFFTRNPEAWTLFVDELIGVDAHRELMRRSLADEQLDLEAEWDAVAAAR
jgi:predicted restriction endonuclease